MLKRKPVDLKSSITLRAFCHGIGWKKRVSLLKSGHFWWLYALKWHWNSKMKSCHFWPQVNQTEYTTWERLALFIAYWLSYSIRPNKFWKKILPSLLFIMKYMFGCNISKTSWDLWDKFVYTTKIVSAEWLQYASYLRGNILFRMQKMEICKTFSVNFCSSKLPCRVIYWAAEFTRIGPHLVTLSKALHSISITWEANEKPFQQ